MKSLYVVCYESSPERMLSPSIQGQIHQVNDYLCRLGIQKIVSGSSPLALQLIEPSAKQLCIPIFVHNPFHSRKTEHAACHDAIPAIFEEELRLPTSPVVFVMKKENALRLFQYIDPLSLEAEGTSLSSIELFHIVCEQDRIGMERLWKPLLPFSAD
ncbi:hypothetical protein [Ectobacillus panaciterrae]|uniref:hypothetical protein n=1 Tax=Ectobacillus panaciterrae TaxID=363872 RepID=UPI000409DCEF|nr:hypothetical protein [Ectobacillus panaciterrae]